jgi:CubicO group peptidase (beta-lactamase class C family)
MKRRSFIATATSASAVATAASASAVAMAPQAARATALASTATPVSGRYVPQLAAFDRFMIGFIKRWSIPGAQLAVAKGGRLVYARGFGYVDSLQNQPHAQSVSPTALFRIMSSTKPFTAVAVLRLIQSGYTHLDAKAFDILHDYTPPPGATPDPRLRSITVRQLLEHSSGFVDVPNDLQFNGLREAADAFHHPRPATTVDLVRYNMGRPLGFAPGTDFFYSNVGYNTLGRIIERLTGQTYGAAVERLVLEPAGIKSMSLMRRTSPVDRLPNEVFYDDGAQVSMYSVYEDDQQTRPYSYAGFDGRAIDAHGGYIAHAPDLTRFLNAVDGSTGKQLLSPQAIALMLARPAIDVWRGKAQYYGLGWDITPGKVVMAHAGAISFGTFSAIRRLPGDITLGAVFNHLDIDIDRMGVDLQNGIDSTANGIAHWPAHDYYPENV